MNYLVISPYYPQNSQQFTIELANKGITVLGIGQEPYEQLDEPLRNSLPVVCDSCQVHHGGFGTRAPCGVAGHPGD